MKSLEIKKKSLLLILILFILTSMTGCYDVDMDESHKVVLYNELIERVYAIDPELNKDIRFVALDVKDINYDSHLEDNMEYWLEEGIEVRFESFEDLKENGELDEDFIKNGLLIIVEKLEGNELKVEKYRGPEASVGFYCEYETLVEGGFEYKITEEFVK